MVAWTRAGLGRRRAVDRQEMHCGLGATVFVNGQDSGSEDTYTYQICLPGCKFENLGSWSGCSWR